jgi:hypothetical protein
VTQPKDAGPQALLRGAIVSLAVLGGVVGLFSGLQATRDMRWGALHVSVGAVAALGLNAISGLLGALGLRARGAAWAPGVGWFVVVLGLLFGPHPGGDILVPGAGGDAIAFLLLGIAGAVLARLLASLLIRARRLPRPPRTASPDRSARR